MDLFTLSAKLGLDTSGYEKGVRGAIESGKSMGEKLTSTFKKIKKAATITLSTVAIKKGIDSIENFANKVAAAGDKIDKQSQALGLSRKAYQEWDYILGQSGASIDSLGVSMKTLNSAVLSAADGGKEAKSAFAQLGLGIHEIENLSMEDQFEAVVRAFQQMPAGAKKSALAVQMFGRNGMELLPLLNSSSTSIDELRQKAEELGLIMSDDAIDASVAYNDAMDTMKRSFTALKYSLGSQLLPTMTNSVSKITNYASKLRKAYSENGLAGVASTLIQDFKNIKWPTWGDVQNAVTNAWSTIVEGVKGLARVAFGDNVDSTIFDALGESISGVSSALSLVGELIDDFPGTVEKLKQSDSPVLEALGNSLQFVSDTLAWIKDNSELTVGAIGAILGAFSIKNLAGLAAVNPMLAGVAAAALLVVTNWDKVKEAVERLKVSLQSFQETVEPINNWLRRLVGGGQGYLLPADAFDLKAAYGYVKHTEEQNGEDAAEKKFEDFKKNFASQLRVAGISAGEAETIVAQIDLSWTVEQMQAYIDSFTEAGAAVSELGTAVESVAGDYNINYHINTDGDIPDFGGGTSSGNGAGRTFGFSNAKGLWDVPYDDYATRLHRGEMVLNASRARDYREGNTGGIDMSALVSAVTSTIHASMQDVTINVKSYLDGKDITDKVNRNTVQQLKARRFAT